MRIGERVLPELSQDSSNNIAREKGAVAVGGAGSGAGLLAFGNSEHSATRACHLWPSPGAPAGTFAFVVYRARASPTTLSH